MQYTEFTLLPRQFWPIYFIVSPELFAGDLDKGEAKQRFINKLLDIVPAFQTYIDERAGQEKERRRAEQQQQQELQEREQQEKEQGVVKQQQEMDRRAIQVK